MDNRTLTLNLAPTLLPYPQALQTMKTHTTARTHTHTHTGPLVSAHSHSPHPAVSHAYCWWRKKTHNKADYIRINILMSVLLLSSTPHFKLSSHRDSKQQVGSEMSQLRRPSSSHNHFTSNTHMFVIWPRRRFFFFFPRRSPSPCRPLRGPRSALDAQIVFKTAS